MSTAPTTLRASAARIAVLAWPVLVGQVAVLAFATIDTALLARHSATDLAALAIGAAAYITVFIGLAGVVLAIGPMAGRLFGARQHEAAGAQLHQAVWLALALSVLGSSMLLLPAPFLALSQASPEVEAKVRSYLLALALALPASLLFTAYRGFNNAVSRPRAVMALQLGGLALKVPLSALLVFGAGPLPSLGITGCGIATCIVMWCQMLAAWQVVRRDPFYTPFRIMGHGLHPPNRPALVAQLKLGVPMGASILVEVTGFSFMAFFISRIGANAVAGHQIAANLVSLLFMLPLALGNAASTLVAQSIGAGQARDARHLSWHSMQLVALCALAVGALVFASREAIVRLYSGNEVIVDAALPLLAWVALFIFVDAIQIAASFVLRAYHIATVPLVIYAASIWGLGMGGGYVLAFNVGGAITPALHGARGYWVASTAGIGAAALGLTLCLWWVLRNELAKEIKSPSAAG
ncbi:MAG: MATE family efflux transporter [Pseudomonadota bacterium]